METKIERRMSKDLQNELKSIKDCKTLEDFDFEKVELIKGKTPENIKERCLQLCRDYLTRNWIQQSVDTIEFRRLSGGLTNQLYYCAIVNPSTTIGDVPQEVAIRIYGPKYFNNLDNDGNERLTDVIIALMVSQNKLGPKIYGLFEDGQIQAFYKHRQFRFDEQNNPKLAEQLFQKLARVHAMDVPIKKSTNWVFEYFDTFYESGVKNSALNELIEELNCETFKKQDLKKEIDWLKETILKVNSPIVFTHIDFRGSNIMVTNITETNSNRDNEDIILCDFEYSGYGYRGFDFGTIACEWGRKVYDMKSLQTFPDDSTFERLIEYYIKESEKIFGNKYSKNKINSIEQIMKEIKLFTLVGNIFFVLFSIKNDDKIESDFPLDKRVMMQFAEKAFQNYFHLKDKFVEQNIFN